MTIQKLATLGVSLCCILLTFNTNAKALSLAETIDLALQHDLWTVQANQKKQALAAEQIAAGTLPDPSLKVGLMNLPTDSFSFNQEAMTQLQVGVAQMLPRGDSLQIAQEKLALAQNEVDWLQAERQNQVTLLVRELWLEGVAAHQAISLINQNKQLFEQLLDVTKANYASAIGKVRQQNVIRAELELVQLDERIANEQQKLDSTKARLTSLVQNTDVGFDAMNFDFSTLPVITIKEKALLREQARLIARLNEHPRMQALALQTQQMQQNKAMAEQNYKPAWGINASYGYRDDADNGMARADFFSVGVSVDLPLFTEKRQDQKVNAAIAQTEASKTNARLQLKTLLGQTHAELANLERLFERQQRFNQTLLQQSSEQAEAALTAYTHDDGAFTDVVWARVNVLNIQLAALNIDIQALKSAARLNSLIDPVMLTSQGAQ